MGRSERQEDGSLVTPQLTAVSVCKPHSAHLIRLISTLLHESRRCRLTFRSSSTNKSECLNETLVFSAASEETNWETNLHTRSHTSDHLRAIDAAVTPSSDQTIYKHVQHYREVLNEK